MIQVRFVCLCCTRAVTGAWPQHLAPSMNYKEQNIYMISFPPPMLPLDNANGESVPVDTGKGPIGNARSTSLLALENIVDEFGSFEPYSLIWSMLR